MRMSQGCSIDDTPPRGSTVSRQIEDYEVEREYKGESVGKEEYKYYVLESWFGHDVRLRE